MHALRSPASGSRPKASDGAHTHRLPRNPTHPSARPCPAPQQQPELRDVSVAGKKKGGKGGGGGGGAPSSNGGGGGTATKYAMRAAQCTAALRKQGASWGPMSQCLSMFCRYKSPGDVRTDRAAYGQVCAASLTPALHRPLACCVSSSAEKPQRMYSAELSLS